MKRFCCEGPLSSSTWTTCPTRTVCLAIGSRDGWSPQFLFFAFKSALPLTWAARLLWLEHKALPVSLTKKLGLYLSFRESVPAFVLHRFLALGRTVQRTHLGRVDFSHFDKQTSEFQYIKGPADDLTYKLLSAFDPRLGLDAFWFVVNDALNGALGEELTSRLDAISFLLGLAFATFSIRGRQPLKTYLMFEALFAGPNVLLRLYPPLSISIWAGWAQFTAVVVLVFVDVVPCIWAIRLLRFGSHRVERVSNPL